MSSLASYIEEALILPFFLPKKIYGIEIVEMDGQQFYYLLLIQKTKNQIKIEHSQYGKIDEISLDFNIPIVLLISGENVLTKEINTKEASSTELKLNKSEFFSQSIKTEKKHIEAHLRRGNIQGLIEKLGIEDRIIQVGLSCLFAIQLNQKLSNPIKQFGHHELLEAGKAYFFSRKRFERTISLINEEMSSMYFNIYAFILAVLKREENINFNTNFEENYYRFLLGVIQRKVLKIALGISLGLVSIYTISLHYNNDIISTSNARRLELNTARESKKDLLKEIQELNLELNDPSKKSVLKVSLVIDQIASLRFEEISFKSISYDFNAQDNAVISIKGHSQNKATVLAFMDVLKSISLIQNVNLNQLQNSLDTHEIYFDLNLNIL